MKPGAKFCRHCGSDLDVGWGNSWVQEVEIPDEYDEDEYEEFLRRELPGSLAPHRRVKNWGMVLILGLLLLAFLAMVIRW